MNEHHAAKMTKILLLAIVAIAIPLTLCVDQLTRIDIVAGAEDDCAYYHGAYKLRDVIGYDGYVVCRYKGMLSF
jgi:hypothetical protein